MPDEWTAGKIGKCNQLTKHPYSLAAAIFKKARGWYCFKNCRCVLNHRPWAEYGDTTYVDAIKAGGKIIWDGRESCQKTLFVTDLEEPTLEPQYYKGGGFDFHLG
jgi:hypothetical protein